jgi:hypothetical protein
MPTSYHHIASSILRAVFVLHLSVSSYDRAAGQATTAPEQSLAEIARGQRDVLQMRSTWAATMTATRSFINTLPLSTPTLGDWFAGPPLPAPNQPFAEPPEDPTAPKRTTSLSRMEDWDDGELHPLILPRGTIRFLSRDITARQDGPVLLQLQSMSPFQVLLDDTSLLIDANPSSEHELHLNLTEGVHRLTLKLFSPNGRAGFLFDMPAAHLWPEQIYEDLLYRLWNEFPETDWFLQDQEPYRFSSEGVFDTMAQFAWYFQSDRDAAGEIRMLQRVLAEIGPAGDALAKRMATLVSTSATPDDPEWLELYSESCALRRQLRLAPVTAETPNFVFTRHATLGGSHYAYTEGQSDAQNERHFIPDSALCIARWDGVDFQVETLLEDSDGVIRDPDVAFDGTRVLFAWKQSDFEDDFHLYEYHLATGEVRQLTRGLGVADYEGAYLPGGDILFNSTRCVQIVDCWWTEVSNLYTCDPDGGAIRRITFDQVHDNYPTVTQDGRVLYTRWEYNDRGQIYPQPLFQMNPDGTSQAEFYGANSWFPTTILHARSVPRSGKVIAIATGHHTMQTGKLILIDPSRGRQENEGVQLIAPERATPAVQVDAYGQEGDLFQYPYPLSEEVSLVTYHPIGWRWAEEANGPRFGIYAFFRDGRRERLVLDHRLPSSQPVPVRPRTEIPIQPNRINTSAQEGTCYVQDVYVGPGLEGVPRGTVKSLRVIALDYRAAGIGHNENGGPGGGALVSTPVAIGNGSWDPKIILGDTPVHEDGSAFFRAPARTPFYFQLLDAQGRMVQTMRSWTILQQGENASCVGCHESKNEVPIASLVRTQALRRPPTPLEPFNGPPRGFSFPREIQPILDRHCISCHNGNPEVPYDLRNHEVLDPIAQRRWSRAYLELTHARPDDPVIAARWRGDPDHPMLNWTSAQSAPPIQPALAVGSNRSRLMDLLDSGHEDVHMTTQEMQKLAAWIDLCVPFCGDYTEAHAWSAEEQAKYQHFMTKRAHFSDEP